MTHARDKSCRGWCAAFILSAGLGPVLVFPSIAAAGGLPGPGEARPDIQRLVVIEAGRNGVVPAPLALAVAEVSSDFVPRTVGTSGAIGVMQIDPVVAQNEFGATEASLWDAATNVRLGLAYLSRLHRRYGGDWELALSHFRGGALHWTNGGYRPHDFTRDWQQRVMYHWRYYQREPLVRAWIREARGGVPRFASSGVPRYTERRTPHYRASLGWPCSCERCWENQGQRQWARHCDDRIVELPRPGGRYRFNGGSIRWSAVEGGGHAVGFRSGPWVAITGGTRFK